MKLFGALLLLATLLYYEEFISARTCSLASRLELYPCTYKFPNRTRKPGKNQQGQYFTSRYIPCQILNKGHRIGAIPRSSRIFLLFSPGKNYCQPRNYFNHNLVFYNINCSGEQFIYFQMHQMDIENRKCYSSTAGQYKCVDYIQVRTPQGNNITENCGMDKTNLDGEIFPFNSVQVIFRSDHKITHSGFYATALCIPPGPQSQSSGRSVCQRRSMLRSISNECQGTRHEGIRIPYGHKVLITASSQSTSISIVNEEQSNHMTRRLRRPYISTLSLHAMDGTVRRFKNNYNSDRINRYSDRREDRSFTSRIPSQLRGPGILYLPRSRTTLLYYSTKVSPSSHACFKNYLVDTSQYIPTNNEKRIIKSLSSNMKTLINKEEPLEDPHNQTSLTYRQSQLLSSNTCEGFRCSQRRKTDYISQDLFVSALQNEKACNPILRSYSVALTYALKKENPVKYRYLRTRLARPQEDEVLHGNRRG